MLFLQTFLHAHKNLRLCSLVSFGVIPVYEKVETSLEHKTVTADTISLRSLSTMSSYFLYLDHFLRALA